MNNLLINILEQPKLSINQSTEKEKYLKELENTSICIEAEEEPNMWKKAKIMDEIIENSVTNLMGNL